jgi:hypothetical protein
MMKVKIFSIFRRVTNSPAVNVSVGLIFMVTGLVEIIATVDEVSIGAHHGAVLFSIFHIIRYLPDLVDGMDYVQKVDNGR